MTLAIDFDQVIHDAKHPKEGRKMGGPMPGAKEAIESLYRAGHKIVIHSCNRSGLIADWMAFYKIPYTNIWQGVGKPICDKYVDDRGVKFTSWPSLGPNPETW